MRTRRGSWCSDEGCTTTRNEVLQGLFTYLCWIIGSRCTTSLRAPPSSLVFPLLLHGNLGMHLIGRGGDLADDCLYSVALPGVVVFADPAIRSGKPKNSHLEEPSDEVMGGFLGERGAPSVIVMRVSRRRSETKTRPAQSENRYYYCRLLLGSTRVVGVSWIEGRKTGTNGEGFEKKVGLCVCSSGCREMNRVVLQPA